jgi:hypothetical protein
VTRRAAGELARLAALAASALVFLAAPGVLAAEEKPGVSILIESPAPGAAVRERVHQARIAGSAMAAGDQPSAYDVMLVIDVSFSTAAASGGDVDGDGVIGVNPRDELLPPGAFPPDVLSTDPEDTILHAEIAAARALLGGLDARRVRVGVATFAGEVDPTTGRRKRVDQLDAWLEAPLSADYAQLQRALTGVLARGSHGATNYSAGIRLAVRELAGLGGAESTPRPDARKVILFLSDGYPTLPVDSGAVSDPGDLEAAVRAAELAHKAGILINTYALGPGALKYEKGVVEMARITQGTFTPVQSPNDIVVLLQGVSFANVEDVVFTNLSTGDVSTDVRLAPDGSFFGYVPVREGANRVRVSALATDGAKGALEFDFEFRADGQTDREKLAELERLRRMTKELLLKREAERIEAFREEQRKELIIAPEGAKAPGSGTGAGAPGSGTGAGAPGSGTGASRAAPAPDR